MDVLQILVFLAVTAAVGIAAVILTARVMAPGSAAPVTVRSGTLPEASSAVARGNTDILRQYRFREGYLLSDVAQDDAFMDAGIDRAAAYKRLVAGLTDICPDVAPGLQALRVRGEAFMATGRIGDDKVTISGRMEDRDVLVLSVGPSDVRQGRQTVDSATLDALRTELSDMRNVLDSGLAPMWREDETQRIHWANAAYMTLVERLREGEAPAWPLPRLFAGELEPAGLSDGTLRRCLLEMPDRDEAQWFEIACDFLPDGSTFYTAHPVDRLVRAETSLREFMQTLTKTFAALPVGLAVFDRRRQLVTFNPSFVALSTIGADFLTQRPDLRSVLDRLRDRQRIPEPRDYKAWRDEIARLEEGAAKGTYHEIWELPDNKAFRVIGRPHPDGAIAFMFEDISAEVSLTRQFRADLDLLQAVLDAAPAAIAIFDADGAMVGANQGYHHMWGDGGEIGADADLPNLTRSSALWASRCKPTGLWGEIRQFVTHDMERADWVEEIESLDGAPLLVRMVPTRSRHTVLQFFPRDGAWADPLADLVRGMSLPEVAAGQPAVDAPLSAGEVDIEVSAEVAAQAAQSA